MTTLFPSLFVLTWAYPEAIPAYRQGRRGGGRQVNCLQILNFRRPPFRGVQAGDSKSPQAICLIPLFAWNLLKAAILDLTDAKAVISRIFDFEILSFELRKQFSRTKAFSVD